MDRTEDSGEGDGTTHNLGSITSGSIAHTFSTGPGIVNQVSKNSKRPVSMAPHPSGSVSGATGVCGLAALAAWIRTDPSIPSTSSPQCSVTGPHRASSAIARIRRKLNIVLYLCGSSAMSTPHARAKQCVLPARALMVWTPWTGSPSPGTLGSPAPIAARPPQSSSPFAKPTKLPSAATLISIFLPSALFPFAS